MPTGPYDCPCGAHVTDPNAAVTYVTDTIIDAVLAGVTGAVKWLGVLAPFSGSLLDVATICASPKARQPTWSLADVANLPVAGIKAGEMLRAKVYELLCTCDDCPPVTNCASGGTIVEVGPGDGYLPDPAQPAVLEYFIPTGTAIYAERIADSYCIGFFSGVDIVWHVGGVFDPANGTTIQNAAGGGAFSWSQNILPGNYRLYIGGTPQPPSEPVPEPPTGLDDWYGPPACTNDDICASLGVTEERIRRIEYLTDYLVGLAIGTQSPVSVTLPGLNAPITGGWPAVAGAIVTALAPIQPAQLVNPTTVPITTSTTITVTGKAFLRADLTTVPAWVGYRGSGDTEIYWNNSRTPGPGWLVMLGIDGVIGHEALRYPGGTELVIPSTCSAVAIQLSPGVEVSLTTFDREITA